MKLSIFLILILAWAATTFAADPKKPLPPSAEKKYLRNNPVWIDCIDSPHASYKFAMYAFETFWQGRPRPMGEDGEYEKTHEALQERKATKEEEKYFKYTFDYKRFLEWKHRVANLLDGDGRVYTQEQMQEHYRIRMEAEHQ